MGNENKFHLSKILWGYSVWQGEAPHLGVSFFQENPTNKIKAAYVAKHWATFKDTHLWTLDGWLITSCQLYTGYVKCSVRKGKQVATLVTPDESVFLHNNPHLPMD